MRSWRRNALLSHGAELAAINATQATGALAPARRGGRAQINDAAAIRAAGANSISLPRPRTPVLVVQLISLQHLLAGTARRLPPRWRTEASMFTGNWHTSSKRVMLPAHAGSWTSMCR